MRSLILYSSYHLVYGENVKKNLGRVFVYKEHHFTCLFYFCYVSTMQKEFLYKFIVIIARIRRNYVRLLLRMFADSLRLIPPCTIIDGVSTLTLFQPVLFICKMMSRITRQRSTSGLKIQTLSQM